MALPSLLRSRAPGCVPPLARPVHMHSPPRYDSQPRPLAQPQSVSPARVQLSSQRQLLSTPHPQPQAHPPPDTSEPVVGGEVGIATARPSPSFCSCVSCSSSDSDEERPLSSQWSRESLLVRQALEEESARLLREQVQTCAASLAAHALRRVWHAWKHCVRVAGSDVLGKHTQVAHLCSGPVFREALCCDPLAGQRPRPGLRPFVPSCIAWQQADCAACGVSGSAEELCVNRAG